MLRVDQCDRCYAFAKKRAPERNESSERSRAFAEDETGARADGIPRGARCSLASDARRDVNVYSTV
jgi:hypothetical protein